MRAAMIQDQAPAIIYDSAELVRSRHIADLRDYWRSKLNGHAMPHVDDIDLAEIAPLRPGLLMTTYLGPPPRVRYDVVGGTHVHYCGHDFTGAHLDEMPWPEKDFVARVHETLCDTRAPVYGWYTWGFRDPLPGHSEFGFFPLTRDGGTVCAGIGFDDCSEFEEQLGRAR
jgi:hypothetical protein